MSENDLVLEKRDQFGYTALAETTLHGNCEMAKCMIDKNHKLVRIPSYKKLLPVVLAVFHKHIKLARYLYRRTPLKDLLAENGLNGVTLMIQVMYTRDFDIALDLIRCNQNLAFALDREECSPLSALASMPHAFKRSKLVFWKQWIYERIPVELPPKFTIKETRSNIPQEDSNIPEEERHKSNGVKNVGSGIPVELPPNFTINETRVNIPKEERQNSNEVIIVESEEKRHDFNGVSIVESVPESLRQPVPYLSELLGIQGLHKMKWNDKYSREILRLMCKKISPLNVKEQNDVISVAIFRAVKEGFTEFVDEVLIANPHLIWARDQQWVSLFQQAVLYREAEIFRLLHEKPVKNSVMNLKDEFRNNVLHMAGMSTPSTRFKCIQGEVLQMQRELQWFKELEQIVHPKMKEERNNSGLTPRELFTSEHNDMKNKGEDWMKNTATSCTVVAALIVTIMFAAAFTVPGGNDQNTGLPIFLNRKLFKLFIVSDALSLFSSSTSALMFLGILTSRYEEEDFLKSLPRKLIIGLFTLFVSIAAMMTAFSSALFLMLRGQSWTFLPVICFASIPVIIFVFMQFSLLSGIPEGLHRHVKEPVQVGYLVVRSLTCCAETIKPTISLQIALYHNQIPVLWTATEQSLSA
nr:ankyrin repeat-containing protein itn1 [Quercus suber]